MWHLKLKEVWKKKEKKKKKKKKEITQSKVQTKTMNGNSEGTLSHVMYHRISSKNQLAISGQFISFK